jgi:hypothetical protein
MDLPTSFHLTKEERRVIEKAVPKIMKNNNEFKRLVKELD